MKLRLLSILAFAALVVSSQDIHAQTAPAARAIAKELAEVLGQRSARELAEAGGEAAVREVVEQAAREGGEQLAREVAVYGQRYGAQALKAFGEAPAAMTQAMKKVPAEFSEAAMRAAAREPQAIAQLTAKIGEDALIVAAKHPGVGVIKARLRRLRDRSKSFHAGSNPTRSTRRRYRPPACGGTSRSPQSNRPRPR